MYYESNRTYTNISNGKLYRMFADYDKALPNKLVNNEGHEVISFMAAAFDSLQYKLKDKSIINLNVGEFAPIVKGNEPTHRKFTVLPNIGFRKI